jgi:hypothetical protein
MKSTHTVLPKRVYAIIILYRFSRKVLERLDRSHVRPSSCGEALLCRRPKLESNRVDEGWAPESFSSITGRKMSRVARMFVMIRYSWGVSRVCRVCPYEDYIQGEKDLNLFYWNEVGRDTFETLSQWWSVILPLLPYIISHLVRISYLTLIWFLCK